MKPSDETPLLKAFRGYDLNNDGTMDEKEFKNIMVDLGYRKITGDAVKELLAKHDTNTDGVISWPEFVDMMIEFKGKDDGKFGTIVGGRAIIESAHGGTHQYSLEEVATYAKLINLILRDDEDVKDHVPIEPNDDSLFHAFDTGVTLCKLVMTIDPECILRAAIVMGKSINVYEAQGNLKMGIAAAKGLGIRMIGIDPKDFIDKTPHLTLGVLW